MILRAARFLAGWVLLGALGVHLAFVVVQNVGGIPVWVGELTRFLPFYWLLLLLCAALLGSLLLRPVFRLLALCNLALFAFGTLDFHWNFAQQAAAAGTPVRVLTYNMKALDVWKTKGGYEGIEREMQQYAPDIIALQDAQWWLTRDTEWTNTPIQIAQPISGLPYVVAFGEFVLASRYPLRDCRVGNLGLSALPGPYQQCSAAQYLQCTVRLGLQNLQVVTAHLARPRNALMAARHNFPEGLQSWRMHVAERLAQSDALQADLSRFAGPLILMGDMNTLEQSPVFANLQRAGLRDAFSEAGQGWGYTHGHALSRGVDLYRIDHILVSPELAVHKAEAGRISESEHNPVIADLIIRP
ncbi:endonuclease/exonuclease/phosphatase family protein [Rhodoferax lacus]|nr:endonuclease/exonuclease/phosphatase family protein [Rhodoferax lacus]